MKMKFRANPWRFVRVIRRFSFTFAYVSKGFILENFSRVFSERWFRNISERLRRSFILGRIFPEVFEHHPQIYIHSRISSYILKDLAVTSRRLRAFRAYRHSRRSVRIFFLTFVLIFDHLHWWLTAIERFSINCEDCPGFWVNSWKITSKEFCSCDVIFLKLWWIFETLRTFVYRWFSYPKVFEHFW